MHSYSRFHVTDAALLRELDALDARDTTTTADRLAVLAEVDARRLYAPAGYPSMFAWCVQARHYSDDAAYRRIRAARTARRFPAIFPAVADGRLHLTAVLLLAPYLSRENVDELLVAATHRTRGEIELLLAQRFPRPDLPTRVEVIGAPRLAAPLTAEPAAAPVSWPALAPVEVPAPELAPAPVGVPASGPAPEPARAAASQLAPAPVGTPAPRSRVTPLAPERYGLQLSISGSLHERLRYAQALLRDEIPMAELVDVIAHGVEALIPMLEKRKFAATERPGRSGGRCADGTFRLASSAGSGSAIRAGARTSPTAAFGASHARSCNSTTSSRWRAGVCPRSKTCAYVAAHTTSTRPSAFSGPGSCTRSASARGVPWARSVNHRAVFGPCHLAPAHETERLAS